MRGPTAKDRFEFLGVALFVRLATWLAPEAAIRLGGCLGRLAFDVVRFRRRVTLSNIAEHLPQGTERLARGIGRRSYVSFGRSLAEFARLPVVGEDYVTRNINLIGLEHLDAALKGGRGAVLVTGHFGSWELMGCVLVRLGYPVKFVVGVQRNRLVQALMNRLRRTSGIGIIEPTSIMEAVRHIRSNGFIAMLSDQDAGKRGVFVDFLGAPASAPKGAARLALATGAPVIPGFIVRSGGLHHTVYIDRPLYAAGEGGREAAVLRTTQEYTRVIERYVLECPDHWLWAHRRWKTTPD
jgi:KDO2-lipid IV(A) lauroyltransferase